MSAPAIPKPPAAPTIQAPKAPATPTTKLPPATAPVGVTPPPAQKPSGGMWGAATNFANKAIDQGVQNSGVPGAMEFRDTLNQYKVPMATQAQLGMNFAGMQQNYNQGNYFPAYQDMMGTLTKLKEHNPALPGALGPTIDKHYGHLAGGMGGHAWQAANAWHDMVGTPGGFAGTMGKMAPGLLRASGQYGGAAGPLALYGLLGGNATVLNDLRSLTKGAAAVLGSQPAFDANQVMKLLHRNLPTQRDWRQIKPRHQLGRDLGYDDLDALELAMKLEEKYHLGRLLNVSDRTNVGSLLKMVQQRWPDPANPPSHPVGRLPGTPDQRLSRAMRVITAPFPPEDQLAPEPQVLPASWRMLDMFRTKGAADSPYPIPPSPAPALPQLPRIAPQAPVQLLAPARDYAKSMAMPRRPAPPPPPPAPPKSIPGDLYRFVRHHLLRSTPSGMDLDDIGRPNVKMGPAPMKRAIPATQGMYKGSAAPPLAGGAQAAKLPAAVTPAAKPPVARVTPPAPPMLQNMGSIQFSGPGKPPLPATPAYNPFDIAQTHYRGQAPPITR